MIRRDGRGVALMALLLAASGGCAAGGGRPALRTYPAYLRGAIVPMVTPYKGGRAQELDLEALARLTDYLCRTRVAALFPVSGMGQWGDLSIEEKKRIIATVVAAARKRKPVLAGVASHRGIDEVLEAARYAESVGSDGIVVVPPDASPGPGAAPGVVSEDEEQARLIGYVRRVCGSVRSPILLYDSKARLRPRTMTRLLDACPNIIGMKYRETEDMDRFRAMVEAAQGRAAILSGSELVALKTMRAGAQGFIGGGLNLYPDLGASLVEAAARQDWPRAEALQKQIGELNEKMEKLGGGAQGAKKILNDVLGVAMTVENRGDTFRPQSYPGEYQAILDHFRGLGLPVYPISGVSTPGRPGP